MLVVLNPMRDHDFSVFKQKKGVGEQSFNESSFSHKKPFPNTKYHRGKAFYLWIYFIIIASSLRLIFFNHLVLNQLLKSL